MASKPRDVSTVTPGDVDADDRPVKEKRRVSTSGSKDKSERRERDRNRERDRDRDRDRDKDRDRERDREHRNSMPSPSALSSLLSHRSSHHKSSSGSAPRSSKTRTSESDLVFPSSSSLSRSQRRKPADGETGTSGGSSSKPHRSSSSSHKTSSGSRRRTKDKDGERREKKSSVTAGGTSSPLPDVDELTKPRSASLSISSSTVDLVPEMGRSRERLPYPSVNKAFSRESVMSREDLSAPPSRASAGSVKRRTGGGGAGSDPLTPDATDLSAGATATATASGMQRSKSSSANDSRPSSRAAAKDRSSAAYSSVPSSRKNSRSRNSSRHHDRPPSPPDTNLSNSKDATDTARDDDKDKAKDKDNDYDDDLSELKSDLNSNTHKSQSQTSRVRIRKSRTPSTLGGSVTTAQDLSKSAPSDNSMVSSQATYKDGQAATSRPVPRRRSPAEASDVDFSPESAQESSSPKTPNPEASPKFFATGADWKQPPPPPHPHPHLQYPQHRFPGGMTPAAAAAAVAAERLYTPSPAPGSVHDSELSTTTSLEDDATTASMASAVPPAPPPPPPLNIVEVPRIDYLMQNGGLPHPIPKNFLAALPRQNFMRPTNPPLQGAETLFQPFFNLLNQYNTVLSGHGSVAVATGHRTVARRLLDRLENVFSRELPAEGCSCVVCESTGEPHRGLGWGEVLERVSGRVDLPSWPPVNIAELEKRLDAAAVAAAAVGGGSGAAAGLPVRPASPVKIDPDIAEEFREHYLRQNKKVRASVDKWMRDCAQAPASAPQEIDDETLAFAILTNLGHDDRPLFNALLSGSRDLVPTVRAPTPMRKPRQNFIIKTGLAIQRLYRLGTAPRDAETTLYLVKNPGVHDLLHTIADIHPSEWEILISGRFDGFLWSGADTNEDDVTTPIAAEPSGFFPTMSVPPASRGPTPAMGMGSMGVGMGGLSRGPTPMSRGTTPFSGLGSTPVSRNATPASFMSNFSAATSSASTNATRQAVSTDEEAEVAALAEIEREIYQGMEALEDAFEVLHGRAEMVRTALRQRSAGLSMRLQQRRVGGLGGAAAQIDVPPQSGGGGPSGNDFERPAWAQSGTPAPGGGIPMSMHPHEFSMDPHHDMGGAPGGPGGGMASEADWDAGEDFFELKPEDSASNISSSQQRRPKRRSERRTPAPIEEEDE